MISPHWLRRVNPPRAPGFDREPRPARPWSALMRSPRLASIMRVDASSKSLPGYGAPRGLLGFLYGHLGQRRARGHDAAIDASVRHEIALRGKQAFEGDCAGSLINARHDAPR